MTMSFQPCSQFQWQTTYYHQYALYDYRDDQRDRRLYSHFLLEHPFNSYPFFAFSSLSQEVNPSPPPSRPREPTPPPPYSPRHSNPTERRVVTLSSHHEESSSRSQDFDPIEHEPATMSEAGRKSFHTKIGERFTPSIFKSRVTKVAEASTDAADTAAR